MPERSGLSGVFLGPRGLRAGWRALLFLGLTLLLMMALFTLLALALRLHLHALKNVITPAQAMLNEAVMLAAALLASGIMSRFERRRWRVYSAPVEAGLVRNFFVGALWGLVAMTALLASLRLAGVYDFGSLAAHGAALARDAALWAVVFLLVGCFEEFFSRGYLQYTLATGIGFWPAAVVNSIAFGALHLGNRGEDILGALSAGLAGLLFVLMLRRTGNLGFAIGFHALWDYAESFIYGVPDSGARSRGALLRPAFHGPWWLTGGKVGPEGSVLVFFILGILLIVLNRLYPHARYPDLRTA